MSAAFTVGLSADFRPANGSGTSWGDIGLAELDRAGVTYRFLDQRSPTLRAEQVDGLDAVLFAEPAVDADTVSGDRPPLVLARFGVGLDAVDLAACSEAGVAVTITPDGARRAVATAALTMILAVGHRLLAKDALVRANAWEHRLDLMGQGLTGKRVGVFGLGNIAVELFSLLKPFGTQHWATDPHRTAESAAAIGVTLVDLATLLAECDIIVVTAALTPETLHAIDAELIASMKPNAILVNVARGPIVDVDALAAALHEGRIGGAGLDVFEVEPVPAGHPILSADRTVLSPHALAWTDEMAIGNGASAIRSILDVRAGRTPAYLANPDVLAHPRFRGRLQTAG